MSKKALLSLEIIVIIVILLAAAGIILYYSGDWITGLLKSGSKSAFDNICCCKGDDDTDCAELYRKACEEQTGFVVMDDMTKCEVLG